ncbi:MAG: hypothetical protein IJY86_11620 [Clostridia bacterium]|nr:hypothetical protein [Clostridia bacterium]
MSFLFDPVRRPVFLGGEWFLREDRDETGLDFDRPVDGSYRRVNVPSDVSVSIPERPDATGVFWYKKTFTPEGDLGSKRGVLHFEAVNHTAHVWLNGKYLGMNSQGYLPFELDATGAILPGRENDLTVRVDTRRCQGQLPTSFYWKNYGGIIRDVWLYSTEKENYIQNAFVCARADGTAVFTVSSKGAECFRLEVKDGEGNTVIARDVEGASVSTELDGVKLWSPEEPNLYTAEISLISNGAVLDRTVFCYGYRDFEARDGKLWLNGKEIFLKGFNRHEDHPDFGGAANREVIEHDLAMIKASGANFIRMCHYPHDRYELELADRLGLCLLVEIPLCAYLGPTFGVEGTENKPQNELVYANAVDFLRRMIARDRNHPSVVIWSVSNENNEPADPCVLDNHKGLIALAKKLDPSRPAVHVSTYSTHADRDKYFEHDDIICFNAYPVQNTRVEQRRRDVSCEESARMIPETVEALRKLYPGKPVIITEFGSRTGVPADSVDDEMLQEAGVAAEYLAAAECANGASVWVFADHRWPRHPELLSDISRFGLLWPDRTKKSAFDVYSQLLKNTQ